MISIKCPKCGQSICDCLLNDRKYLARKVGELMRTGGKGSPLSPNNKGVPWSPNGIISERYKLKDKHGADYYCYATPDWLRETIKSEYGFPELDVSSSYNMEFGKRFYSPEQDGMKQDWIKDSNGGIVFGNPPYIVSDRYPVPHGHQLGEWVEKAFTTSQAGSTVIFILPLWRKYDWIETVIKYAEVRLSGIPFVSEGFGPMEGKKCGNTNWYSEYETVIAIFRPNQIGFLGSWIYPVSNAPVVPNQGEYND